MKPFEYYKIFLLTAHLLVWSAPAFGRKVARRAMKFTGSKAAWVADVVGRIWGVGHFADGAHRKLESGHCRQDR